MNEKELEERLSGINHSKIELPKHRRQLRQALLTFVGTNSTIKVKSVRPRLFPMRLTWQTTVAGALVILMIVSLSLSLPSFMVHNQKVLAEDIALKSPQVKAVLVGTDPEEIGVTESAPGVSRVVMKLSDTEFLIADVDMKTHTIIRVIDQTSADTTMQQALAIAQADSHVQALLNSGLYPYFGSAWEVYPDTFSAEVLADLKAGGITDPDALIGFTASIVLSKSEQDTPSYVVFVNLSTEKVVGITPWLSDMGMGSYGVSEVNGTITGTMPITTIANPTGTSVWIGTQPTNTP